MDTKKVTDTPQSQPSLQELSENKALKMIVQPSCKFLDFEQLHPRAQRLMFDKLQSEITRLQLVEESWLSVKKHCPELDLELLLDPELASLTSLDDDDGANSEEMRWKERIQTMRQLQWFHDLDDHELEATHFRQIWFLGFEDDPFSIHHGFSWENSDLVLTASGLSLEGEDGVPPLEESVPDAFVKRISSQLLLYRIISVFDMHVRPYWYDSHEKTWMVRLRHCDGVGELTFWDSQGWPAVILYGKSEGATKDALELINYLCGRRCKHTTGLAAGLAAGARL